ncbi:MAG: glutamate racemase [candidate division Zixibacteria bacterium]|nr:glutamate racemase [candidate division Zixibacteria bacterium]
MNSFDKSSSNKPIGVFDSGVGGLTVVKQLFSQLPDEQVVYFGDTGRFPYGIRSAEIIKKFSRQNVNFLLEQQVKFIVVACNTASAQALDYIRNIYNIPMIGVIEPGAKAASEYTTSGRIGVIGTEGTIESLSYTKALLKINPKLKVFGLACPLFVALAENGYIDKKAAYLIAEDYLKFMKKKNIDTLVLGCTHYPPLKKVISKVMGRQVRLVDSADETARSVNEMLGDLNLYNTLKRVKAHRYYVSDTPDKLKRMSKYFVGKQINKAMKIDINMY